MLRNRLPIICLLAILFFGLLIQPFGFKTKTAQAVLVGNTNNATLTLNPLNGVYKVNSTFPIDITVNTHGQSVVVTAAYLLYNPNIIEVLSIDTTGSVFSMQAENIIDPINGKVKITMGVPNPGVNVTNGKLATINIRGKTDSVPSSDNLTFDFTAGITGDSDVILNDGLGTEILSGVFNARFNFDGTAPANVSGFTATPGNNQITLSWTNPATDFNGVTILRKTTGNPTNITDGTVVYDNSGTSYTDTGLANGTTYYYTAFSRDVVLNYSTGISVSSAPLDSIAPSTITLNPPSALSASSVALTWTAVGDDGNVGTATSYDIRYSTANITAANWGSATQVSGEPIPKISGSPETMTITGLTGGTIYFFAIKAIDKVNNNSLLSNIVSFKIYKTGDLNRDYLANSIDFGILMSYWGSTARPPADINQDGAVNSVDFGIMLSQWGSY